MMKNILIFLKWSAIVLIVAPLLLYLIWFAANIQQDPLAPEIKALLSHRPDSQLDEKNNAFFDTIGLAAPPNANPHSWGLDWFNQASTNDRAILEDKPISPIKLPGYPSATKQVGLPCSPKTPQPSCLKEVSNKPSVAQTYLNNEIILLNRFDALLDKEYQEPYREMHFMSDFTPRHGLFRATQLAQIRISLEIARRNDGSALRHWKNETTYILRILKSSQTLIDALICTSILSRYQRILADYISFHPAAARIKAKELLAMMKPFDRSTLTLQRVWIGETAFSTRSLLSSQMRFDPNLDDERTLVKEIAIKLLTPLFDKQATANEMAGRTLEYARISSLEGNTYRMELAKLTKQQSLFEGIIPPLHNPVGKFLSGTSDSQEYTKYFFKVDDVLANKQLLVFAISSLSKNILSSETIIQELKARQSQMIHPFTGKYPILDKGKRVLKYNNPEQININYVPLQITL